MYYAAQLTWKYEVSRFQNFLNIFWGGPMEGDMPFIKDIISFSLWGKPKKKKRQQWTTDCTCMTKCT